MNGLIKARNTTINSFLKKYKDVPKPVLPHERINVFPETLEFSDIVDLESGAWLLLYQLINLETDLDQVTTLRLKAVKLYGLVLSAQKEIALILDEMSYMIDFFMNRVTVLSVAMLENNMYAPLLYFRQKKTMSRCKELEKSFSVWKTLEIDFRKFIDLSVECIEEEQDVENDIERVFNDEYTENVSDDDESDNESIELN